MISITSSASNVYTPAIGTEALRTRLTNWYDAGYLQELTPYSERLHKMEGLPIAMPDTIEQPTVKLNTLYWPIFGVARYAYAVFLLDGDQLAALQADSVASNAVTLSYTDSPDGLDAPRTFPMYYIADRPVSQNGDEANPDLYYVTFCDVRYLWQNVTGMPSGSACTWVEVLNLLASKLPDQPAAFSITDTPLSAYLTPGPNWLYTSLTGRNTAWLMDAAAALVGSRIVFTPTAFSLQRPTAANLTAATDDYAANVDDTRLTAGGLLATADWSSSVPAQAKIIFPGSPPVEYDQLTGGTATGAVTAWLDPSAYISTAEQAAIAVQWASDYYAWQAIPYDVTWAGFVAPSESAYLSALEINHDAGLTHVYRPPVNYGNLYTGWNSESVFNEKTVTGTQYITPAGTNWALQVYNGGSSPPTPYVPQYPSQVWATGHNADDCTAPAYPPGLCGSAGLYSTAYGATNSPWNTFINSPSVQPFVSAVYLLQDQCTIDADGNCTDDATVTVPVWGVGQGNGQNGNPPGFGFGKGMFLVSGTNGAYVVADSTGVTCNIWTGGGTAHSGPFASVSQLVSGAGNACPMGGYAQGGFAVSIPEYNGEGQFTGSRHFTAGVFTGGYPTTCNTSAPSIPPACSDASSLIPGATSSSVFHQSPAFLGTPAGPAGLAAIATAGGIVTAVVPSNLPINSSGVVTNDLTESNALIGGFWLPVNIGGESAWMKVLAVAPSNPCASSPPMGRDCTGGSGVYTPGGTFSTLAACQASPPCSPPPPTGYNCVSGNCISAPGGTYSTLAACTAACSSPPPPPPPPGTCPSGGTVHVTISGPCAAINGSYALTYSGGVFTYTNTSCTSTTGSMCVHTINYVCLSCTDSGTNGTVGISGFCADGSAWSAAGANVTGFCTPLDMTGTTIIASKPGCCNASTVTVTVTA